MEQPVHEKKLTYEQMLDLVEKEIGIRLKVKTLRNDVCAGRVEGIVWIANRPYGTASIARRYIRSKTKLEPSRRRAQRKLTQNKTTAANV